MDTEERISKLEEKYKTEIEDLKLKSIAEKEELTSLFLDKLKEVENYHKKMLQDFIVKSNTDLEEIQAKHKEKMNFLASVHNKEINKLQKRIDALTLDKKELEEKLSAIPGNLHVSNKEKFSNIWKDH